MSVKRFKFVSPGIFINEIDNSQLPRPPSAIGPTVIGRLQKGPGLIPLTVQSMTQFVEVFGNPVPGGEGGDVWRDGNKTAPTYAAYAAQAYLQNSGPVNVVRLLGVEDSKASAGAEAGWQVSTSDNIAANNPKPAENASVYGLYMVSQNGVDRRQAVVGSNGHTVGRTTLSASLAAVWYFEKGAIELSGAVPHGIGNNPCTRAGNLSGSLTGSYALVKSTDATKMEFAANLFDGSSTGKRVMFNFDPDSDKYIRKVFNTNPTLTNSTITQGDGVKNYWLGETFDRFVRDNHGLSGDDNILHKGALTADGTLAGMVVPLHKQANPGARLVPNQNSRTDWFISQDINVTRADGEFDATKMQKLFKFHGI